MSLLIKAATIQVRVTPFVKAESEKILHSIGLNMSDAVELYLRRLIVDGRIPFDIVALDPEHMEAAPGTLSAKSDGGRMTGTSDPTTKRNKKDFQRVSVPGRSESGKRRKK